MAAVSIERMPEVGDALPRFTRIMDFDYWNRFAAVNDEFVPIHMDDVAGRAAGYAGAIGMGNLLWALLHNCLREWVGETGLIRQMSIRFRSPSTRGQVASAAGRVSAVKQVPSGLEVALEIWIEDAEGAVLAPGTAIVLVLAELA